MISASSTSAAAATSDRRGAFQAPAVSSAASGPGRAPAPRPAAGLRPAAAAVEDERPPAGSAESGFDRRGTGHGMLNAGHVQNRWRVALRHIALVILSKLPGTRFKSRLFAKLFKIRMGRDVGLASNVFLDPYDPSMISFGDNVIVGYDSKIFVHAFTLNRQRVRPVRIGSNVLIGAFCVIAPGVKIGDGASIAPGTIVSRNVPAGAMVTGNVMQIHRRKRPVENNRR